MRQILLISIAALFFACASKEEKLIVDYEQTLIGAEIVMEIQSIEKIREITAKDSLAFYDSLLMGVEDIDEQAVKLREKHRDAGDEVLAHYYKVIYTLSHPPLDTDQTVGAYYSLSPDKEKVLERESFDP